MHNHRLKVRQRDASVWQAEAAARRAPLCRAASFTVRRQ